MSMTLDLVCDQCRIALFVGQHANSCGWYLYTEDPEIAGKINAFVDKHQGHPVRFLEGNEVPDDYEYLWSDGDGGDA